MEVKQERIEEEPELDLKLKLYGFDITRQGLEELLKKTSGMQMVRKVSETGQEIYICKCEKVIENSRNTLKILIWSNRTYSLINKTARIEDFPRWSTGYGKKTEVVWDLVSEGKYALFVKYSWSSTLVLSAFFNASSEEEVSAILDVYKRCVEKVTKYSGYKEMTPISYKENTGIVSMDAMVQWETEIDATIKQIEKLEAEEKRKKEEALKTRIKREGRKTTINALDGHTYVIECDGLKDEEITMFVYQHRYDWTIGYQQMVMQNTFFSDILRTCLEHGQFMLSMDNKEPVYVEIKRTQTNSGKPLTLAYLNGKRIAYDDIWTMLTRYFLQGEPLTIQTEEMNTKKKTKPREQIVQKGITGYITDLEGEIPVSIDFEKQGNNWYLVIGEKKMLLRGGITTIKSLETVLTGSAHHYECRHSTEEFFRRLCKVFTIDEALEIVTAIKELGKLVKAIGGTN